MNFTPTFLYIKQHAITKKFYLGKTKNNPEIYLGSGTLWKKHIEKHGKEHVITLWYCLFYDRDEILKTAITLSKICNVVKSEEWLNLIEETGVDNGYLEDTSNISKKLNEYYDNLNENDKLKRNKNISNGLSMMSDIDKEKRKNRLIKLNKSFKGKSKGLGRKSNKRILYEKSPKKCEYCSEPLKFERRFKKFCCNKCANIVIGINTKLKGGHESQKLAVSNRWKGVSRGKQSKEHTLKVIQTKRKKKLARI